MEFTTKPALGTAMITGAADAGAPFAWAAADEVYGRSGKLRQACAQALLAIAAAPPAPPAASGTGQPDAWRDTGKLPAAADRPPGDDPGLVKVSVPEARGVTARPAEPPG